MEKQGIKLPLGKRPEQSGTKHQVSAAGPGEFTKPVYDSKFTKWPKGMSFVNSSIGVANVEL
jgi:hypothetical protein